MHQYVRSLALLVLSVPALFAHEGDHQISSFALGLLHPLTGLDHLLAMVAVGLLGVRCAATGNRQALWQVPASFIGCMLLGGVLALFGVTAPEVEWGIALSLLAFGVLIALASALRPMVACAVVGVFALLHGHAHVSEMHGGFTGYASGFLLATALLHAAGIGAGMAVVLVQRQGIIRATGGALAFASLFLLLGLTRG